MDWNALSPADRKLVVLGTVLEVFHGTGGKIEGDETFTRFVVYIRGEEYGVMYRGEMYNEMLWRNEPYHVIASMVCGNILSEVVRHQVNRRMG